MISHPLRLESDRVRLRPLEMDDWVQLAEVAAEPEIWTYFRGGLLTNPERLKEWIEEALALRERGIDYPFVTVDLASGRVAGSTRYRLIDTANRSVEIGGTWLGREFRGTGLNLEAKRLMLDHAFEVLGVIRVQLRTDLRNKRSQTAIERLGAIREGIHRKDFIYSDGYQRSSVFYSITDEEWPQVKARLGGQS